MNFYDLENQPEKDFSNLKKVKVALLGDSATQLLVKALKGYGYEVGYNFDIFEADYDQVEMQTYDLDSELYHFKPEYVIIYHSTEKLLKKFYKLAIPIKHYLLKNILRKFQTSIGQSLKK